MSQNDFNTDDEINPIGKEWKGYWRSIEKDPNHRRETRQDKKTVRRQIHKKHRKNAKEKLKNWENSLNDEE